MSSRTRTKVFLVPAAVAAVVAALMSPGTAAGQPLDQLAHCAVPTAGTVYPTAAPDQVALDPAAVTEAIAYAGRHGRMSVQVFRNNCLVGSAPQNPLTDAPLPIWSSTKSVVSMLTGIAQERGLLRIDDPIGNYLPTGPEWGDAAHRAITIRDLLTQTSGLRQSIVSEAASLLNDPHVAQEALAQPLVSQPGAHFAYGQRAVDLLAFVVQQAVGADLQEFAQQSLFTPIGIPRESYIWLRDRAGNTYGYANLMMPANQYAKLGLLLQNHGMWNEQRVLSSGYIDQAAQLSPTNGCYGMLFWTNRGDSCTSASIPEPQTVPHRMIPSAPPDLFAMVGFLHENNFVIPSLNMTVTWTGVLGDTAPDPGVLISANPGASDLYHNFFRILMRGVRDTHVPDPGPYVAVPADFSFDPNNFADPAVLGTNLFPNHTCTVVSCALPR